MTKVVLFFCVLLLLTASSWGQIIPPKLPCNYSGKLLLTNEGKVARLTSEQMKKLATHKVEVAGFIRQLDFRSTIIVDLLIGPTGKVLCTQSLSGINFARKPVENALRSWRFAPMTFHGKPVAYLGELEFMLCNIDCGDEAFGVSLLK